MMNKLSNTDYNLVYQLFQTDWPFTLCDGIHLALTRTDSPEKRQKVIKHFGPVLDFLLENDWGRYPLFLRKK